MSINIIDLSSEEYKDRIIHETKVDFNQRIIVKPIHIMQYDNNLPIIAVEMFKNGENYILPVEDDLNVFIKWGKKDHTFVWKQVLGCNETRHIVYFEVNSNMAFYYGLHTPIIEIRIGDDMSESEILIPVEDKVAGSSYIPIEIDRNPVQSSDITSTTEFIDLTKYVNEAKSYADEASLSAAAAHEDYEYIEQKIEGAVTEVETAESTALSNVDTAKTNALNDISTAKSGALSNIATDKQNALDAIDAAETVGVSGVNAAKQSALDDILAAKTDATGAVTIAETGALSDIASALSNAQTAMATDKQDAIDAIDDAKEEAVEIVGQANHTFEIGEEGQTTPSESLMVGGIFYKKLQEE